MLATTTEPRPRQQPTDRAEEKRLDAAASEPLPDTRPLGNGVALSYEPADASWSNLSGAERILRALLGVAMLAGGWSGAVTGIGAVALQVFGWVPLITGVAGWCPFYAVLGCSSRRRRAPAADPGELRRRRGGRGAETVDGLGAPGRSGRMDRADRAEPLPYPRAPG